MKVRTMTMGTVGGVPLPQTVASMQTKRRGAVLVMTLFAVIALTGVVLVLARTMRGEVIASANRLSQVQAMEAEKGAEQFVKAVVEAEVATPGTAENESWEARQVGGSLFWVVRLNRDDETQYSFGLTDEGGKIDLNTGTQTMLSM